MKSTISVLQSLKVLLFTNTNSNTNSITNHNIIITDAFNTALGVATSTATLYGTIGLTGICFILIFYYIGKKNGPKLQTIEQKEVLEVYGKEVIHRKLLHTFNLIAKQLEKVHGDTDEIRQLLENIRTLDYASKGYVEVEEEDTGKSGRKQLLKSLAAFGFENQG